MATNNMKRAGYQGNIGNLEIERVGEEESRVEWRIHDVLALPGQCDDCCESPLFSMSDMRWYLRLYPNRYPEEPNPGSGWLKLSLIRRDPGDCKTFHVSVGVKGSSGVKWKREGEKEFSGVDDYHFNNFCKRSEVASLMQDGILNITCVLKKPGSGIDRDNDMAVTEVEVLNKQIRTLRQRVHSNELESALQISTLESEKLSIADEYEHRLAEKITVVNELKEDNNLAKMEVKSLNEQIQILHQRVYSYELESENYKRQISALESEKLSIADEYKHQLEEKITAIKELEKDKDCLKKEVEHFVEQTKTLEMTVKYFMESEKYKTQIRDLESKKSSMTDEYKCLLEEKLEILTELEKKNERLRAEMHILTQQIKDYVKCSDEYCSIIASYKNQVTELKDMILLNETNYKKQLQASLNESSELRKDIDVSKTEVESLNKQIQTLHQRVHSYELESENYKKQISVLKSEKLSIADKHEHQLEEKMITIKELEKTACDDEAKNDDSIHEDNEESKDTKRLKQLNKVKNTKKISLPARHGDVIRSLKSILAEGSLADFNLKSAGRKWAVHKAILESRCQHFQTLLGGAEKDKVRLDDITEDTLADILLFLYAGEVRGMSIKNVSKIYATAHKLNMEDLKSLCVEYMKECMCPELVCRALLIANERDLKERALNCFFRESSRVVLSKEWEELKENHPATIVELFQEFIKREKKTQRKEEMS